MKKASALILFYFALQICSAQVSGNINQRGQVYYSDNNIDVSNPGNSNLSIVVKGLANLTADTYVAVFSVAQTGKTTEEVNNLIDSRIGQVLTSLKSKPDPETYTDMITFVPVYEYETEKKLFSKRTYNEIPAGFEVKKNIHIKYKDPKQLNDIMTAMAAAEIYDLVRVDYYSDSMEAQKNALVNKAKLILQEKLKNYRQIIGPKTDSGEKRMAEGFKIVYPAEMYRSYRAYTSSSLNPKKDANVNQADKPTTLYYQPVMNKEFDFVINPAIIEPTIQVMYEIKLDIIREQEAKEKTKEYYMVTPAGDVRKIELR